jgi:Ras-related protein Rab-6A
LSYLDTKKPRPELKRVPSARPCALAGFNIKALFRKIAAALPGMDSAAATAAAAARQEEQLVDVKLTAAPVDPPAGGCAC